MTDYVLSPAAQSDLDEIWDYTADRWSIEHANKYITAISDACQQLANGTRRSEPIDEVRPGYNRASIASHHLYFRTNDAGTIDIVRILHQRMDPSINLTDENLDD